MFQREDEIDGYLDGVRWDNGLDICLVAIVCACGREIHGVEGEVLRQASARHVHTIRSGPPTVGKVWCRLGVVGILLMPLVGC